VTKSSRPMDGITVELTPEEATVLETVLRRLIAITGPREQPVARTPAKAIPRGFARFCRDPLYRVKHAQFCGWALLIFGWRDLISKEPYYGPAIAR